MLNIQDVRLEDTRVYQDIEKKVRGDERKSMALRLLNKKFGRIPEPIQAQIAVLSLEQLESLSEALLDFQEVADLDAWLSKSVFVNEY
jgi:predicted transposase YdaD